MTTSGSMVEAVPYKLTSVERRMSDYEQEVSL